MLAALWRLHKCSWVWLKPTDLVPRLQFKHNFIYTASSVQAYSHGLKNWNNRQIMTEAKGLKKLIQDKSFTINALLWPRRLTTVQRYDIELYSTCTHVCKHRPPFKKYTHPLIAYFFHSPDKLPSGMCFCTEANRSKNSEIQCTGQ